MIEEFTKKINDLSNKITLMKEKVNGEESTKMTFIAPFISALGYDIFNPIEVTHEFTSDIGIKKGEKVDYLITKDNDPIIMIEAKDWKCNDVSSHKSQLHRYFSTSLSARFGIITNGIIYRFYSDIDNNNVMDSEYFLELDLENINQSSLIEVYKFSKLQFEKQSLIENAESLKYKGIIKSILKENSENPSDKYLAFVISQFYNGRITDKVKLRFKDSIKKCQSEITNELIKSKFDTVLNPNKESNIDSDDEPRIITTDEEIESYHIIKSILRKHVNPDRIKYKDYQTVFNVCLDNSKKVICRVISDKNELVIDSTTYDISELNSIYNIEQNLIDKLNSLEKHLV